MGIDSSSIASIASKHQNNLQTFTCGFDMANVDGIELVLTKELKEATSSFINMNTMRSFLNLVIWKSVCLSWFITWRSQE